MSHRFGGPVYFIDRNDINTDEIIPAKHLVEINKQALKPYLLEDLVLDGFDSQSEELKNARVIVTRSNFGCGSSREHAVWVFEVNDINVIIGESFARIFRQNCFNCGILAVELPKKEINLLFRIASNNSDTKIIFNTALNEFIVNAGDEAVQIKPFKFTLNEYDRSLIKAGGWLEYARQKY